MSLQVNMGWLLATMLLSIRVAAATAFAPVFGVAKIPAPAKVIVTLALSAAFASVVGPLQVQIDSLPALLSAAMCEVAIGLAFGFGFMVAYAATQIAGRLLDVQIGFGAASVLNPATQTPSPLIGNVFGMVMIFAFLALDGHHVLIRAMALSANSFPPGSVALVDIGLVIQQSGAMFVFGFALAAPVMFLLWLADIALAIAARSMPQLNVFVLSFAAKVVLGVIGLAISIQMTQALFNGIFAWLFRFWDGVAVA